MIAALLTPSEAAPLMGVSQRTVRSWVESGQIPPEAVMRVGISKDRKHIRLKTRVLVQRGLLTDQQASS